MVEGSFTLVEYGGGLYYYLFELANFSFCGALLLLIYKLKYLDANELMVWFFIFFTPFLFNYFLFDPLLFPDQTQYAWDLMSHKFDGTSLDGVVSREQNTGTYWDYVPFSGVNPITLTGNFLGLVPLPNYMTMTSMAFSNKVLLLITYFFLRPSIKNTKILLMLFLIPSIVLYSSLALRETLITCFTLFFLITLLRGRYILCLSFLLPLIVLKIQIFAVLAIYYFGRVFLQSHKSFFMLGVYAAIIVVGAFILEAPVLQILNYYRIGFAAEDFDLGNGITNYAGFALYGDREALILTSIPNAIFTSIIGLPNLMLMPLPWNWSGIFHPIQALESLLLIFLYYWAARRYNLFYNQEFIYLSFTLLIGMMLYSLLAFNEGTFVRYRFGLFYPMLIAVFYIGQNQKLSEQK